MSLKDNVEILAKATALTDADDLPGLAALHEQVGQLAKDPEAHPALAELEQINGALQRLIMREEKDAKQCLAQISATIDKVVTRVSRSDSGAAAKTEPPSEAAIVHALESVLTDLHGEAINERSLSEITRGLEMLESAFNQSGRGLERQVCVESLRITRTEKTSEESVTKLIDGVSLVGRAISDPANSSGWRNDAEAFLPTPGGSTSTTNAPAAPTPSVDSNAPVTFPASVQQDENLAGFLAEAREHLSAAEESLLALERDAKDSELINRVFRAFHTIKGVAGFMNLTPIVRLAHSTEFLLDGARSGTLHLERERLDLVLAACDLLTQMINTLEGAPAPTQGKVNALIQSLDRSSGSATTGPAAHAEPSPATPSPAGTPAPQPIHAEPADHAPASTPAPAVEHPQAAATQVRRTDQTVKVSTGRMDALVNLVGELVIAQQMVSQDPLVTDIAHQRVQRNLSAVGKIIRDLQEVSMLLRMVTLKGTFQRMARLVRDVAVKAGKVVDFQTSGEDVELDRNVVEEIADPLVHMIRNACDHGLETAEQRREIGKPESGTVWLRAFHSSGSIVIEIEDDGRGLDRDRIIAKAVAKGLLPADRDPREISDSEAFNIIFLPGFSTAEKVTDISGRGVGMDVVRRNIEALRGKIDIRSTPGKGTTFSLRLPLTMAIIDGMVVRVGSQRYVLPTLSIQQSFRPRAEDVKTVVGSGEMVRVRGTMLPIYRLNRVMCFNEGKQNLTEALLIVMESDGARFCLMVDEILGQQQVVIKSLNQTGQPLRGVSGGAILGDGRVALIVDVARVVALATEPTDTLNNRTAA